MNRLLLLLLFAPLGFSTALAQQIPEGKGDTTKSGKFEPSGTPKAPPANRDEAEKTLRAAPKVEELSPGKFRVGKVTFDASSRIAKVPATINMRQGIVEYALTTENGKVHEALLTTSATPKDLHLACLLLGMKGTPLQQSPAKATVPADAAASISVSWETNGPAVSLPLNALLKLAEGGPGSPSKQIPEAPWHYNGSGFLAGGRFVADLEGSLISLIHDPAALINNPSPSRVHDDRHVVNTSALPRKGTPVTLRIQLPAKPSK